MATVKPKTSLSVPVEYQPLMVAVHKARAMAWTLEQLGAHNGIGNNLVHALEGDHVPEETREWLQAVVGEALRAAFDDIEREYRKAVKEGTDHWYPALRGRGLDPNWTPGKESV